MAWRSSKSSLAAKRRIPKRHQRPSGGLGLPDKMRTPISIEEIRRLGQDMVLTSRAFEQGARSSRRGAGGRSPSEGATEGTRPTRRGATR
jgi:hypothetical protein